MRLQVVIQIVIFATSIVRVAHHRVSFPLEKSPKKRSPLQRERSLHYVEKILPPHGEVDRFYDHLFPENSTLFFRPQV